MSSSIISDKERLSDLKHSWKDYSDVVHRYAEEDDKDDAKDIYDGMAPGDRCYAYAARIMYVKMRDLRKKIAKEEEMGKLLSDISLIPAGSPFPPCMTSTPLVAPSRIDDRVFNEDESDSSPIRQKGSKSKKQFVKREGYSDEENLAFYIAEKNPKFIKIYQDKIDRAAETKALVEERAKRAEKGAKGMKSLKLDLEKGAAEKKLEDKNKRKAAKKEKTVETERRAELARVIVPEGELFSNDLIDGEVDYIYKRSLQSSWKGTQGNKAVDDLLDVLVEHGVDDLEYAEAKIADIREKMAERAARCRPLVERLRSAIKVRRIVMESLHDFYRTSKVKYMAEFLNYTMIDQAAATSIKPKSLAERQAQLEKAKAGTFTVNDLFKILSYNEKNFDSVANDRLTGRWMTDSEATSVIRDRMADTLDTFFEICHESRIGVCDVSAIEDDSGDPDKTEELRVKKLSELRMFTEESVERLRNGHPFLSMEAVRAHMLNNELRGTIVEAKRGEFREAMMIGRPHLIATPDNKCWNLKTLEFSDIKPDDLIGRANLGCDYADLKMHLDGMASKDPIAVGIDGDIDRFIRSSFQENTCEADYDVYIEYVPERHALTKYTFRSGRVVHFLEKGPIPCPADCPHRLADPNDKPCKRGAHGEEKMINATRMLAFYWKFWLGYNLHGLRDNRSICFASGDPKAGKSFMMSIIRMIFGDYSSESTDPGLILIGGQEGTTQEQVSQYRCLMISDKAGTGGTKDELCPKQMRGLASGSPDERSAIRQLYKALVNGLVAAAITAFLNRVPGTTYLDDAAIGRLINFSFARFLYYKGKTDGRMSTFEIGHTLKTNPMYMAALICQIAECSSEYLNMDPVDRVEFFKCDILTSGIRTKVVDNMGEESITLWLNMRTKSEPYDGALRTSGSSAMDLYADYKLCCKNYLLTVNHAIKNELMTPSDFVTKLQAMGKWRYYDSSWLRLYENNERVDTQIRKSSKGFGGLYLDQSVVPTLIEKREQDRKARLDLVASLFNKAEEEKAKTLGGSVSAGLPPPLTGGPAPARALTPRQLPPRVPGL